jgi:ketosteroid isomerase-like protein
MTKCDSSLRSSNAAAHMKLILLMVAILVVTYSLTPGQTSRNSTGRTGKDDKARRQVLATDDRRTSALRRGDSMPLHRIYADDYTLVTPATGVIRSKAEQIDDIVSGRVRYEKIEVTERTVRLYGDAAIVLAREKYSIMQAGEQVGGDIRFTRTYKKFGPDWRVIATHGTFVK